MLRALLSFCDFPSCQLPREIQRTLHSCDAVMCTTSKLKAMGTEGAEPPAHRVLIRGCQNWAGNQSTTMQTALIWIVWRESRESYAGKAKQLHLSLQTESNLPFPRRNPRLLPNWPAVRIWLKPMGTRSFLPRSKFSPPLGSVNEQLTGFSLNTESRREEVGGVKEGVALYKYQFNKNSLIHRPTVSVGKFLL